MNSLHYSVPEDALHVVRTLKENGYEAHLVGGCVRDILRNEEPKDWDVATNALPDVIVELFEHTYYENDFGTVGVVNDNATTKSAEVVEVTPYRTESTYSDKRRPDSVEFSNSVTTDLSRRDFTANAIAFDPESETFIDPYNGKMDIEKKILRAVGDPSERFEEDGLRILRALRLQAELNFSIEEETLTALHMKRSVLSHISKERIRDEFSRIIASKKPAAALEMARRLEILPYIAPELEQCVGVEQTKAHKFDVFTHLLYTLQHTADKDRPFHVKLAALFHDIGKPPTRKRSTKKDDYSFYGHEVVGARMTKKILQELRFSKETVETVSLLVRWHMFFSDPDKITLSAVRRLLQRVGTEHIWDLINLRIADRIGTGRPKEEPYRLRKYQAMIEEVLSDPVSVSMLAINGTDLMETLNVPPGPRIGHILHSLLEEVIEDPKQNTRETLLKKAEELAMLNDEELEKRGKQGRLSLEKAEDERMKRLYEQYRVS